jgi:polysaccharide export outer membrane protein
MSYLRKDATAQKKRYIFKKSLDACFVLAIITGSLVSIGQVPRPAIIPMAQTSGTSTTGTGVTSLSPSFIGGLSDLPIGPGDTVHINVFDAPELSVITRVSMNGDIPIPLLGVFHVGGLSSADASKKLETMYKDSNYILSPSVAVTVDSTVTGITVLGEVHSPGIYPPSGKHMLSDVIAAAGGLTANSGRVVEISNAATSADKTYLPWDPTMHNTDNYDRPMYPGDRVLVRACGISYVGGNVAKAGAYSLCGSRKITATELVALAGGTLPGSSTGQTMIIRSQPDGTKIAIQVDIQKILKATSPDVEIQEDDVIYVPHSAIKDALKTALQYSLAVAGPLVYVSR